MRDDIRWESLDRWFSGESTPEEAAELERWMAEAPERRAQVGALRDLWARAASQPGRNWDAQAAWQRLAPTLDLSGPTGARRPALSVVMGAQSLDSAVRPRRWVAYATRVAAGIALVAAGATIWRLVSRTSGPVEHPVALREYTTPRGQRATIGLADGTRIMLGPASTLRAPRDVASGAHRDVYLEGQAFFEVTHDASRPFVVHAANGVAEDIGTRFVVTSYAGDSVMRVVVAEGTVAIGAGPALSAGHASSAFRRVLETGDLGTVGRSGRITTAHHVALDEYVGWTTGQLVFRDVHLDQVAATLAQWYDVDIRLSDPAIASRRVTLTTSPNQPLAEVLSALTLPLGLEAERSGRTVVIRGDSSR